MTPKLANPRNNLEHQIDICSRLLRMKLLGQRTLPLVLSCTISAVAEVIHFCGRQNPHLSWPQGAWLYQVLSLFRFNSSGILSVKLMFPTSTKIYTRLCLFWFTLSEVRHRCLRGRGEHPPTWASLVWQYHLIACCFWYFGHFFTLINQNENKIVWIGVLAVNSCY